MQSITGFVILGLAPNEGRAEHPTLGGSVYPRDERVLEAVRRNVGAGSGPRST